MFCRIIVIIIICCLNSSCGYRFLNKANVPYTTYVPYIEGDMDGNLTNTLIQRMADLGYFTPISGVSDFIIQARVKSNVIDPIGFQFAPKNIDRNIIANENRHTIELEFSILSGKTQEKLFGSYFIKESIDYDFLDQYPCKYSTQREESTVNFSLGQLDSREGALSSSIDPLFHKITDKMSRIILYTLIDSPIVLLDRK